MGVNYKQKEDYRQKYCNNDVNLTCWQHGYLFNILKGTYKDMFEVCRKCIYFKGEKEEKETKCQ